MKTNLWTTLLLCGCTNVISGGGDQPWIDEGETTLTIDAIGAHLELETGPMEIEDAVDGTVREVTEGRKLRISGLGADYRLDSEGADPVRLTVPAAYEPFLTEPAVEAVLAEWNVAFDWTSPRYVVENADQLTDAVGSDEPYNQVFAPYWGGGACSDFAINPGNGSRFWPGGNDGGALTACIDRYEPGDMGVRNSCHHASRTLTTQYCNYRCTGWQRNGFARSCNSDAECPSGCGSNDGDWGRCSPGEPGRRFCQVQTITGWTGPRGCSGAGWGPYQWCSVGPGVYMYTVQ